MRSRLRRKAATDYLLGVKGNQPSLKTQIEAAFVDSHASAERHQQVDTGHGRQVIQIARVLPAQGVVDPADWPKCKTIARIDAVRLDPAKSGAPAMEQRYYLSSRDLGAVELAQAVRSHWGIENRLHWVLDVNFGEDACQLRKDHAPQNLSLLRKIALNLIRTDTTCPGKAKVSLRIKRKRAAWDDEVRMAMMGIHPL